MSTKIYYDGVNISKYINQVDGVTTNTSYIASAGITDYNLFIEESLDAVSGKPISFQVTSPHLDEIQKQALFISQKADNIYVKIPIILPNGQSSSEVISDLVNKGVKVNVTCIHTPEQASLACESTEGSTPSIISLFAGGVSDSGNSPQEMFKVTSDKTKDNPLKEILYAGCQRVYSLIEARNFKADIITVPDGIMDKLGRMEINELDTSIKKSELFFEDGKKINLKY